MIQTVCSTCPRHGHLMAVIAYLMRFVLCSPKRLNLCKMFAAFDFPQEPLRCVGNLSLGLSLLWCLLIRSSQFMNICTLLKWVLVALVRFRIRSLLYFALQVIDLFDIAEFSPNKTLDDGYAQIRCPTLVRKA